MNFFKILLLSTLFLLLVTTACGNTDNRAEDRNNKVGYSISLQSNDKITDISEYAEYGTPTGKWFLDGGGNIGFSISSGTRKPNTEVSVSLLAHPVDEVDLDRNVRFQLTKRDKDNKLIEVVEEEKVYIDSIATNKKYFSTILPDKESIHYMLSAEILGENGQVEDTLVTSIYVPNQVMNGELYLDKDQYTSNDTLTLKLDNNGPTNLSFGLPYKMEIYRKGKWEQVSINIGFDSVGLIIEPGQKFQQNIPLNQLKEPGLYRVLKDIDAEGTDLNSTLTVEFEIEED
jgi:hypothetical protein